MRYAKAKIRQSAEAAAYRIYVTDALKAVVSNTARFAGGVEMKKRYADLISSDKPAAKETAEEIISRLKNKLNGEEVD